jgi:two-component system response regulator DevR
VTVDVDRQVVRVAVVEDEHLLADLLGEWVSKQDDLCLAGVFRTADEARRGLRGVAVDVLVVDLGLPDGEGLDVAADVVAGGHGGDRPRGVVILSGDARPDLVAVLPQRLDVAWAYLLKSTNTSRRLRQAIDAVVSGFVMIDPELHRLGERTDAQVASLSDGERQVLAALAAGLSNRAIAERVHLSVKTVERMLTTIYSKLGIDAGDDGVNPRVHAVMRAAGSRT